MRQPEKVWVARFAVALSDPLIAVDARVETEQAVLSLAGRDPHWFAAWSSGLVSDIVRTLDPDDPWRKITVVNGQAQHPDGSPFGSYVDSTDLVHAQTEDIRSDLGLAALEQRLNARTTELLAVAGGGLSTTLDWMRANLIPDAALEGPDAEVLFRTVVTALRWAMHRRRLFVGYDDQFLAVSGVEWANRAYKIISGEDWDEARAARFLKQSSVAPGTYAQFS
ncbi:hypothetical protein [Arthrobacter sp. CP30]